MQPSTYVRAFLSFVGLASALSPAQWRSQSIYQVVTDRFARTDGSTAACSDWGNYCGGTYQGIINKVDYIQEMGFSAIWISPVVKNIEGNTKWGTAYHGYWQTDINSVETNFGSAADLVALSNELHSRGMYLMVDVVTNHMAQENARSAIQYDKFNPFNNESYFHPPLECDYNNGDDINLQHCWQGDDNVALADLRTEDTNVQTMFNSWIAQLVQNFTIDGLRIDSAKHVDRASLQSLQAAAGGIHVLGEVYNGDPKYVGPFQDWISGFVNFPQMYRIKEAFSSTAGSMTGLKDGVVNMQSTCKDTTVLGSFIENHDLPRFPSMTQDMGLIRNAISFKMLQDGIPIIYQGQEQKFSGDGSAPNNREPLWISSYSQTSNLYKLIKTLNKIRSWAIRQDCEYATKLTVPISLDDRTTILRKGNLGLQVVSVFNNRGENGGDATITLSQSNSEFLPGQSVVDVIACKEYVADSRGNLGLTISKGEPIVLYSYEPLERSGICGR